MNAQRNGLSILILEDEAAARIATRRYLQFCGHQVAAAENAAEAIEKARALRPDVLICDWQLNAGGDGVDVARQLQGEQGVEVIFMTAHELAALRRSASGLRTIDCLRKPISLGTLAAAVNTVADNRRH